MVGNMKIAEQRNYFQHLFSEQILPPLPNPLELVDACYALAKENPDRIAICEYVQGEHPACIVGTALSKNFGWSAEDLQKLEQVNIEHLYNFYIDIAGDFVVQFQDDDSRRNKEDQEIVLNIINAIQERQDNGEIWSRVMASAICDFEDFWDQDPPFIDKILLGIFNYHSFSGEHRWREYMYR